MLVKITNGNVETYPYSTGLLRHENPNISFPKQVPDSLLKTFGVYSVTLTDKPSYTQRTQNITQDSIPALIDGVWTVGWTVTNKTTEEIAEYDNSVAANNRSLRNNLLAETDFYALSDVTMSSKMASYRKALRDITTHSNWPNLDPDNWPTKPEV
tara:strand:- start:29 stop:493 length:465 start_codon:yes stop_codon:yes gene_type:complete